MIPAFARLEIRIQHPDDLVAAAAEMTALSAELRKIAINVTEPRLMRLAAHDAIRDASSRTRNRPAPETEV